jgi:GNAT superfamily N-acetyltransferase
MTLPTIRRATSDDVPSTAALIATAFHPLDVAAWLVPDPQRRIGTLTAHFDIIVGHALTHGLIHLIDDDHTRQPAAAAVWIPHLNGPPPPPPNYDKELGNACGPATPRFQQLDQLFALRHPHRYPHHHLALLATRPDRQRHQLGTALLHHHHNHLDTQRIASYLEATSPQSRELYKSHGYRCLEPEVRIPNGPPWWPMWRERDCPDIT